MKFKIFEKTHSIHIHCSLAGVKAHPAALHVQVNFVFALFILLCDPSWQEPKKSTLRIRSITKINFNVIYFQFKSLFTWKSGAFWPFSVFHVPIEINRSDKFRDAILAAASFFRFWTRFSQKAFKNLWSTQIFFAC